MQVGRELEIQQGMLGRQATPDQGPLEATGTELLCASLLGVRSCAGNCPFVLGTSLNLSGFSPDRPLQSPQGGREVGLWLFLREILQH